MSGVRSSAHERAPGDGTRVAVDHEPVHILERAHRRGGHRPEAAVHQQAGAALVQRALERAHYAGDGTTVTLGSWQRHGESAGRVTTIEQGVTTTCHVRLDSAAAPRAVQVAGGTGDGGWWAGGARRSPGGSTTG